MTKQDLHALALQAIPGQTLHLKLSSEGPIIRFRAIIEMDGHVLDIPDGQRMTLQAAVQNGGKRLPIDLTAKVVKTPDPEWFSHIHDVVTEAELVD